MIPVEICIPADDRFALRRSLRQAMAGGAARVELCRELACGGVTPAAADMRQARRLLPAHVALQVLVRPRNTHVEIGPRVLSRMLDQIDCCADEGADGVVLGALRGAHLDWPVLNRLLERSHARGLSVTFHRAYDELAHPENGLSALARAGVSRVLSSGSPGLHSAGVAQGAQRLASSLRAAGNRIELVIGGGLTHLLAARLLQELPIAGRRISLHAHSCVMRDGHVDAALVRKLVRLTYRAPS